MLMKSTPKSLKTDILMLSFSAAQMRMNMQSAAGLTLAQAPPLYYQPANIPTPSPGHLWHRWPLSPTKATQTT